MPGTEDLHVYLCDGHPRMFRDSETSWWIQEKPPKKWRKLLRGLKPTTSFGATDNGVCHPQSKAIPHPLAKIVRLQKALRALSGRVRDRTLLVAADGLVGPHTIGATTHAMNRYAPGFTHAVLTHADILRDAPQLAAWIEKAPIEADASTPPPSPPAPLSPTATAQPGATMPPQQYYYPQPGYAPPPPPSYYGPSRRGPGGLPRDEASLDVKAFIPAQYDHIQVHPGGVMAVLGVGVIVYLVATRKKKAG